MTRRKFLSIAITTVSFLLTFFFIYRRKRYQIQYHFDKIVDQITHVSLSKSKVGELDSHTLESLVATTEAVVDTSVETVHYEIYFEWRARNLMGYQQLYNGFTQQIDGLAHKNFNKEFKACTLGDRQQILKKIFPSGAITQIEKKLLNENHLRYYKYIGMEILNLFARTDAWILFGYTHWPGQARGFDYYRKPPGKSKIL